MNQTPANDVKAKLEDLKTRQLAGEHMPCPRCGRDTMDTEMLHNALSRHTDVYICSSCGMAEALLDAKQSPMSTYEWACFSQAKAPECLPAREIMSRVMTEYTKYLTELYTRWQDEYQYEDFTEYQNAAKQRCPGLIELKAKPFVAVFQAMDGKVIVRFEFNGDNYSVKVSAETVE